MDGWHHRLDGHEFEWTPRVGDGQGGLECCDSWGHKESDMTEQLTELNWTIWGCVETELSPTKPPDKDTINPHLDFSLTISWAEEPAKTCWIPGLWKLWDDKCVLFQAVTFMGICYMAVEDEHTNHGLMFGWAEEIPFTLQKGSVLISSRAGVPNPPAMDCYQPVAC